MGNLKRGNVEIAEQEEQAIFRRRQWPVGRGRLGTRRAWLAFHCPNLHMPHKCLFKGFDQLLELLDGQAGQVQDLGCFIAFTCIA